MIEKLKPGESRELTLRLGYIVQKKTQKGTIYSALELTDEENPGNPLRFAGVMYEARSEIIRYVSENMMIRAQVTAKTNGANGYIYIVKSVRQTKEAVYPCKYPKEIYDCKTDKKTLSINAEFIKASALKPVDDPKKVAKPYYIYEEPFSRLVVTIISSENGARVPLSGNISVNDIAGMFEDSKAARNADIAFSTGRCHRTASLMEQILEKTGRACGYLKAVWTFLSTGKPPQRSNTAVNSTEREALLAKARSAQFTTGTLKGKTPYDVLVEAGTDPEKLKQQAAAVEKQKNFLLDNLEKYKGNQSQIDASEAAIEYYKKGYAASGGQQAQTLPQAASDEILLLKGEPKPLIRKKDPNTGLCPVHEVSVKYIMGYRSPVQIQITVYDAPVARKESGAINVQQTQAQNRKTAQFNLSWKEWANFMRRVEAHMARFEMLCAKEQLAEANASAEQNRAAAKEAQQAAQ